MSSQTSEKQILTVGSQNYESRPFTPPEPQKQANIRQQQTSCKNKKQKNINSSTAFFFSNFLHILFYISFVSGYSMETL